MDEKEAEKKRSLRNEKLKLTELHRRRTEERKAEDKTRKR